MSKKVENLVGSKEKPTKRRRKITYDSVYKVLSKIDLTTFYQV